MRYLITVDVEPHDQKYLVLECWNPLETMKLSYRVRWDQLAALMCEFHVIEDLLEEWGKIADVDEETRVETGAAIYELFLGCLNG